MELETIAVHAGRGVDTTTGAVTPPIHLSTTFERGETGEYPQGYTYSRTENPNRGMLEQALAALEGGAEAAAFASGMAAIAAVFQALRPGDHAVLPDDCYHGLRTLVREVLEPWGLTVTYVDMREVANVTAALRPETRLVWVETPSNPLLKVCDIRGIAAAAHAAGARCVVDGTFATPVLQRPLKLGADLVVHATTKYLGGHSDVLGGVVVAAQADDFFARVRGVQKAAGSVPSPFDCWLLLRSLPTLPLRVRNQSASALAIANWLVHQPLVARVYYPGLAGHRGHGLAAVQMVGGFGGMLSVEVQGGAATALAVAAQVKVFTRATSLGGVESLIEHRRSIEPPDSSTPPGLLRLSIGLEHVGDLVADLQQALDWAGRAAEHDPVAWGRFTEAGQRRK